MKLSHSIFILALTLYLFGCKTEKKEDVTISTKTQKVESESVKVIPINHGSLILESHKYTFYIDPVGGAEKFSSYNKPDYLLITDVHGDHLNLKTLEALDLSETKLIVPQVVADQLPEAMAKTIIVLNNGEHFEQDELKIEAIPMYNLREEALKFHPKGRGNGYVISVGNERIYISGDTEDIPEMRQLKHIDKAFVCMNLPYTMTVESAASAVLDFKPKVVYPYHYRGTNGLSDVRKFKTLVNTKNRAIQVELLNWY